MLLDFHLELIQMGKIGDEVAGWSMESVGKSAMPASLVLDGLGTILIKGTVDPDSSTKSV